VPPVVVIRPLSGYINRLQAIASARILAADLQGDLWIDWEATDVAPVDMGDVLDPDFCDRHAHSRATVIDRWGVDPAAMEPYLQGDPERRVVTLAGLDRGEQAFMPDLAHLLQNHQPEAIIISAGGKFTLAGDSVLTKEQARTFRARRAQAYAQMPLHPGIEQVAQDAMLGRAPFVGLHLRYSDRSLESPWRRQIDPVVRAVAAGEHSPSLFIASDTGVERQRWHQRARAMGLDPWSTSPGDHPRSDPRSARGALVDWRILTQSRAMVYFAASSFAEEAAVASGSFDKGVGLTAGPSRRVWMEGQQLARAAATYPRRHLWPGR
jgi:hypothetical protein